MDAHYRKGVALSDINRNEEAVTAFENVTRLNPQHAHAHNQMGNALSELGRFQEAGMAYRRHINLNQIGV